LQRHPGVQQLLENEQDDVMASSGECNPTAEDPEHTNPFVSSAWQLALLKFHHDESHVVPQAMAVATAKALQLPLEDPKRLRSELLQAQTDDYLVIPFVRIRKKHPLDSSSSNPISSMATDDKGNKKRRRSQVRFVKPRAEQLHLIKVEPGASDSLPSKGFAPPGLSRIS
jgi:hypothetical protein